MKKSLIKYYQLFILLVAGSFTLLSQNNTIVLNGAYTILNGGTQATPVYLVVNQSDTAGIVRISGHIVSEQQYNNVKWVVGSNMGNYVFPFGIGNNAADYIPFTFNKTSATSTDITMSTWATNVQNMPHANTTNVGPVTQMTGVADSVVAAIDRFWDITSSSNVTADLTFSYLGSENTTAFPNDTVKAQHWNGTSWDAQAGPGNLGVTAGVGTVGPIPNQTTFSPWILTVIPNCPDAAFIYNTPFCEGDTATILPIIQPNSAAGVFSANSAQVVINSSTGEIDLTTSQPGIYWVYNTLAATNTCPQKVDSFEITINPISVNNIVVSICQGDSVFAGGAYQNTSGVYYDTLTNATGCDSIITTNLTVNPLPVAVSVSDTLMCFSDLPITYMVNSSDTVYWYSDSLGTNLIGTGNTFTPSVNNGGIFTYYVQTQNNGCVSVMNIFTLTVLNPEANISTNPSPASGVVPLTVDFSNNSSGDNSWDFGDGNSATGQSVSNTYNAIGEYLVTLTVTDSLCSATDTITVSVFGESVLIVPNVFSPNGDGVNDVFTIKTENISELSGTIWNRWGELLYSFDTPNVYWEGTASSGKSVPDGTYYYIIKAKGKDGKEYELKGSFTLLR